MDVIDLCPEDKSKFSYNREVRAVNGTTTLCPTSCHLNKSWSSVNAKVMLTAENIVQQQSDSWNPSLDDDRVASMRVFTSVMLHAWRQRRADVRRLQQVVERLQRNSMHSKNELHVSNTLMRVEQKRCKELQLELKKSTLSISQVRTSCEKLTTSVRSLKADNEKLELDLRYSRQKIQDLEGRANKCKQDLLNAIIEQRNMQLKLADEQSNVHKLMCEKEQLLKKMRSIESDQRRRDDSHVLELEQKNKELSNMRSSIESLERIIRERQIKRNELSHCLKNFERRELEDSGLYQENEVPQKKSLNSNLNQSQPVKCTLALKAEDYGLSHLLYTVHHYTTSVAFFVWMFLLPNKSLRNGCMPHKKRIDSLK